MHSVDASLELILSHCAPLPAVAVALEQSAGRVLRRDAKSDTDFPPFDRSAMDGFALAPRNGGFNLAQSYTLVGSVAAGDVPAFALKPGECARIFTGALLPQGATQVLPQEDAEVEGMQVRALRLSSHTHIRRRGEDARKGDVLIPAGQILHAAHLSILASIGITCPLVGRRPRVMHIVSGNELVHPSAFPRAGQIRDSNSTLVAALCSEFGATVRNHIHAPDDEAKTLELAASFPEITYDVLLFSGGSGPGSFDFCRSVFEKLGFTLHLQGVNVRPGKPLLFATRGQQLAFGLPGNPLSHFVVFQLFVRPALIALLGATEESRWMEGVLTADLPEVPNPRTTYWPARWMANAGRLQVEPLPWRSSGHLSSLTMANALLHIPANVGPHRKGDSVRWLLI